MLHIVLLFTCVLMQKQGEQGVDDVSQEAFWRASGRIQCRLCVHCCFFTTDLNASRVHISRHSARSKGHWLPCMEAACTEPQLL